MSVGDGDDYAFIGRSLVGIVPFVGPLLSEIVTATIPNQRIDRIEALVAILEQKVSDQERALFQTRMTDPESIDLLEDSFVQASRALSEERKQYIAALLKNSVMGDEVKYIEGKRLSSILAGLNDIEILMLMSHRNQYDGTDAFYEKHKDVLQSPSADLESGREQLDKHAIFQTHQRNLMRIGLLKPFFKKVRKGELPEFDLKTGIMKSQGHEITPLGRLLLRRLDLDEDQLAEQEST